VEGEVATGSSRPRPGRKKAELGDVLARVEQAVEKIVSLGPEPAMNLIHALK